MKKLLEIRNLRVNVDDKEILKGIDLAVDEGEIHVLLGPNGSGKSTLMEVLAGHPRYEVVGGTMSYGGMDLLQMAPEDRSTAGILLSFQSPVAIPGVSVFHFMKAAYKEKFEELKDVIEFRNYLEKEAQLVGLDKSFLDRNLHEGFSGGEKKKLELLQLRILKPDLAILDEIDSGLDVDTLKIVANTLRQMREESPMFSVIIVTHQRKLIDLLAPDAVHIMVEGKILKSGGVKLLNRVEEFGFKSYSEQ